MRRLVVAINGLIKRMCGKCREDRLLYCFKVKGKSLMYCKDCFDRDYIIKKRKRGVGLWQEKKKKSV